MDIAGWRREWTEIALVSVVSILLYEMNMLILFLLPLQVLFVRRGAEELFYSGLFVITAVTVIGLLQLRQIEDAGLRRALMWLEFLLPLGFAGGLVGVNIPWSLEVGRYSVGTRKLERLLTVTAAVGLASIPVLVWLSRSEELSAVLRTQVEMVRRYLEMTAGTGGEAVGPTAGSSTDTESLVAFIRGLLLRNYLFAYYLVVCASWWLGTNIGNRTRGASPRQLVDFRLPDWLAWPLIVSWAVVLLGIVTDTGALDFAAWNVGLVLLFTYAMQGIGILHALLERRGSGPGVKSLLGVALVVLLFWPGVNLIIIVGLPGLGVSEIWIKFRESRRNQAE